MMKEIRLTTFSLVLIKVLELETRLLESRQGPVEEMTLT